MGSSRSNCSPKEELGGWYFWNSLNLKVLLNININMNFFNSFYYYFHVIPKRCHVKKNLNIDARHFEKRNGCQNGHAYKCFIFGNALWDFMLFQHTCNYTKKNLGFFFANNNSYSKNVGSSYLKKSKEQLVFKKELVNNHGFLVVYYYVFYLLDN